LTFTGCRHNALKRRSSGPASNTSVSAIDAGTAHIARANRNPSTLHADDVLKSELLSLCRIEFASSRGSIKDGPTLFLRTSIHRRHSRFPLRRRHWSAI
jgi:hypothetical protein